jgi:LPXTG-motif cell wall-anchored protein
MTSSRLRAVNAGAGESVSGGGCAARASVQITFDSAVLVTTQSSATGQYSAHLIVPARAVSGSHRITIVCVGASGAQVTETADVNVELPFTGTDTIPLGAAGLSLVFVGALLATRRRRHFA